MEPIKYREVAGFPNYRVGTDGSAWSFCNGCWVRLHPALATVGNGYRQITLRRERGGKPITRMVHRLVLEAFVGPRPRGAQACHGDGNPGNNAFSNLRWDTPRENHRDKKRHGTQPLGSQVLTAKLTEGQVKEILRLLDAGRQQKEIAPQFGVQQPCISKIATGRSWMHLRAAGLLREGV